MTFLEATGYFASALVAVAFCMKDIVYLRIVAIASNLAFLTYGVGLDLAPVWLLHAVLLPVNVSRLWQAIGYAEQNLYCGLRHHYRSQLAQRRPGL
jgi:hypothetical protein